MKVQTLKKKFSDVLQDIFPQTEILSFFHLLSEFYLGKSRLELVLEPELELSRQEHEKFEEALVRLANHEPIQYILSESTFFGLTFQVNQAVLIPRPETEELVAWILAENREEPKKIKILDIGTGSGCIAISLAKNLSNATVFAMDISDKALEISRKNAKKNRVHIEFIREDVLKLQELPHSFDVIVSNPPYVRGLEKTEILPNVLQYEPELALFVKDENPLLFYDKITKLAQKTVLTGGSLFFEVNQYMAAETEILVQKMGFSTELRTDIFGKPRMLKATPINNGL